MKRLTTIGLIVLATAMTATSCMAPPKITPPNYGNFPDVHLLPPEQANPITWAKNGVLHGKIPKEDWRVIIGILSRVPDLSAADRQLVEVSAFDDPPVAVRMQLGYGCKVITFVKTDATSWRIAGIYNVDSSGQQKLTSPVSKGTVPCDPILDVPANAVYKVYCRPINSNTWNEQTDLARDVVAGLVKALVRSTPWPDGCGSSFTANGLILDGREKPLALVEIKYSIPETNIRRHMVFWFYDDRGWGWEASSSGKRYSVPKETGQLIDKLFPNIHAREPNASQRRSK